MTSIIFRGLILLIVSGCTYPYSQPTRQGYQTRHRTPTSHAARRPDPPKPIWNCNPYDDKPCYIHQPPPDAQAEGETSPITTETTPVTPYRKATVIIEDLTPRRLTQD